MTRPEELFVLDHALDGLRDLAARGYALVVVTNQRGVARGLMSSADLDEVHAALARRCAEAGVPLDGIYACTHERDAGCACRKPAPGLLFRAAEELGLDISRSLLIGDSDRDIEAGRAAGVPLLLRIDSDADWRPLLERVPRPRSD